MILAKLGELVTIGFVATGYGVIGVEKMFTESYQPWAGDRLSSLNKVRQDTIAYEESPGFLAAMCQVDARRPPPFDSRKGLAVNIAQEGQRDNELYQQDVAKTLGAFPGIVLPKGTNAKSLKSASPCGMQRVFTFFKILVTSGTNRKKNVWVLRQHLARTVGDL